MSKHVQVAILGAGTAGLTAMSQIQRETKSFLLIDGGELGTTCARVGCMPSKALIQIADDYHRRKIFPREGIAGSDELEIKDEDVLEQVQHLRDVLVDMVLSSTTDEMDTQFIAANARFVAPGTLEVADERITADRIVIATGSAPVVPSAWREFGDLILTTDELFELEELPDSLAVIGLGVIGLEAGQALSRLGVQVTGFDRLERIAGLADDEVNKAAIELFSKEFPLHLGSDASIQRVGDNKLKVSAGSQSVTVDKVLVSIGRKPNVDQLDLQAAGIAVNKKGIPEYDPHTMQIAGHPVFIAGDVTSEHPLLHEALDDGRIAGLNAVGQQIRKFRRKTPLAIVFTDPNIVVVGEIPGAGEEEIVSSSTGFNALGRALVMGRNRGLLKLYAAREDGRLLGAAMVAPAGEHLGHLLAWSIQQRLTAAQMLRMPYYHPVMEEILQPALRAIAARTRVEPVYPLELEPLA